MQALDTLIKKLIKYHWSPDPPYTYTINIAGKTAGLGLIAMNCPAAFNIAWAASGGDLSTYAAQRGAVVVYSKASLLLNHNISRSISVEDLATLMSQKEFGSWLSKHEEELPEPLRTVLVNAMLAKREV